MLACNSVVLCKMLTSGDLSNNLLQLEISYNIPFLIFQHAKDLLEQLGYTYYEKCNSQ